MELLVIADRPPQENILTTVGQNRIDLVCTLGDLDQFMISDLKDLTLPKLGVYGNHDSGAYFEPLGIKNMHLSTFEYQGITFGGFEGCVRYKDNPTAKMYTQDEAVVLLANFPRVDVMLVHCPPYGVNDEPNELAHQGFYALRVYVERQKPRYLLHGHTYPTTETIVHKLGDTEIIYVHQDAVIDLF